MQRGQSSGDQRRLPLTPAKRHLEVPRNQDLGLEDYTIRDHEASPKRSCTPEKLGLGGQTEPWGGLADYRDVSQISWPNDLAQFSQGVANDFGPDCPNQTASFPSNSDNGMWTSQINQDYHWPGEINTGLFMTSTFDELPDMSLDSLGEKDFDTVPPAVPNLSSIDLDRSLPDAVRDDKGDTSPLVVGDLMETHSLPDSASDEPSYDTCFGLVLIDDLRVHVEKETKKKIPKRAAKEVNLEPSSSTIILRDKASNEYCGLLGHETAGTISSLLTEHKLQLSATLEPSKRLSVLVYGRQASSREVGDFLSDRGHFLQQPDFYDESATYRNPQWLVRPGSEFKPEKSLQGVDLATKANINSNEKSKVAELLDSATGPAEFKKAAISDMIVTELMTHQIKALSMMIEKESGVLHNAEFPSLWVEAPKSDDGRQMYLNTVTKMKLSRRPRLCLGGLLADEMGLGKTLTILALIASSLGGRECGVKSQIRPTLVVAPLSTLTHWQDQIKLHFKEGTVRFLIYHGSSRRGLVSFDQDYDIILTNYETIRAESTAVSKTTKPDILSRTEWHRIVLDEAHVIRNRSSKVFEAVHRLEARHRWCVTGTPIQNSIEDIGALVGFLRAEPFNEAKCFIRTFVKPISASHQSGWERLRTLIQAICLRRTKTSLADEISLPPPLEVVEYVHLDADERRLYDLVKRHFTLGIDSQGSPMNSFHLITRLRQICDHGPDLLPATLREWLETASSFTLRDMPQLRCCEVCGMSLEDNRNRSCEVLPCYHQICDLCLRHSDETHSVVTPICPICHDSDEKSLFEQDGIEQETLAAYEPHLSSYRPSSKVKALLRKLREDIDVPNDGESLPVKSVVFSLWTKMLDLVGKALMQVNIEYRRVDGSMSLTQRQDAITTFRQNRLCYVLLASIGSAGVGLDFTMASRVHIIEPGWNPMLECQALQRVHRLGQKSKVVSTRYVVAGDDSVEKYIRQVQEMKAKVISYSMGQGTSSQQASIQTLVKEFKKVCSE